MNDSSAACRAESSEPPLQSLSAAEPLNDLPRPVSAAREERSSDESRLNAGKRAGLTGRRVPPRYRPALYFETFYNVGTGAFLSLFLLSSVVLKTIIGGDQTHLAVLAALFGGSSLFSPVVSYLGRRIPMRLLVTLPNLLVAALLAATVLTDGAPMFFSIVVGLAFVVRVFPRVGEMNMYRVIYPATHRSAAVGWLKAVAAVSAFAVTLCGYWWFSVQPRLYWLMYWAVAGLLVFGAWSYLRIPVSRRNLFARDDGLKPHQAFWQGLKVFLSDKRFLWYQFGFSLAGFANHMALVYVAEVLKEDVLDVPATAELAGATEPLEVRLIVGLVVAVLPVVLMMTTAPFWGRLLDRINPMYGRSIFNTIQCAAYSLYALGGMTRQVWPFLLAAALHGLANGGGTINWLTGSLYFATPERVSLYNAIHVGLTGLRGMIAPAVGLLLIVQMGAGVFWVAAALSLAGAVVMLLQGMSDPGPSEART
ncbi:MAG: hypothetical protein KY476_18565 [Planctomycetes bacterium]|nr:hypothetical protein [Planctomycetota bacterium]